MQQNPLLATKLYIPGIRSELVSRPHLIERLSAGLRRKLTLISAPAGFGKTTLLSEWVANCGQPVAWVSLDEADNDLTRFLVYFVAALQTVDVNVGGALSLLHSPKTPPTEAILMALINEIAETRNDFVLIFDDYHVIETPAIDETLTFLLDHLPPQMHLGIASRVDPSLPLSRLRARGQVTEIRVNDLRFSVDEITAFLDTAIGLRLSSEDVTALERRTEGWIAGVQLTALSMQGRDDITGFINSFTGSNRYILDYLVEEVYQKQSESIQTFLLQTAILDRMTGTLCDAVCTASMGDGQTILQSLERANLFIVPLDDERRWYRYHHLFADLLSQRLHRTQPNQAQVLHLRASEWYENNRMIDDAVKHAIASRDFERSLRLIEELADVLWERGEPTTLLRWLEGLPDEIIATRPSLCNFYAWSLFMNGQNQAAEQWLQVAEETLISTTDNLTDTSSEDSSQLDEFILEQRGRTSAIRASIAFREGDGSGIFKYSNQALEYLPEKSLMWRCIAAMALGMAQDMSGDTITASQTLSNAVAIARASGNIYLTLSSSLHLGTILMNQGRLRQVYQLLLNLLEVARESGVLHTEMAGCLYDELGFVLCEWNNLGEAMHHLEIGSRLSRQGYDVGVLGWSYLTMLRALFTQGDLVGAQAIIQEMEKMERRSDVPPWYTSPKEAWKARLWLKQGDLETASQWAQERGLNVNEEPLSQREDEYIVLLRILVAQGQLKQGFDLMDKLLAEAEKGGRIAPMIQVLIIQALAHNAKGDTTAALTSLERVLSLAKSGGYVRIFVDEGPQMAKLLRQAKSNVIFPEYVDRLLAAFEPITKGQAINAQSLVDPLTNREVEILRLFETELSGPEIARELVVALSTVRYHTKNIYSKLCVSNRRAAVHRAEELGLL